MRKCARCNHAGLEKGRGLDSRRIYRCLACGYSWSEGLQGRRRQYSIQRPGYQFADTGAAKLKVELLFDPTFPSGVGSEEPG